MLTEDRQPDAIPRYFNRELSWIRFNRRVLEEALNPEVPLLERVRFLSIFSNNLDEFFMIRVSGIVGQLRTGILKSQDNFSPSSLLTAIRKQMTPDLKRLLFCWKEEILPALASQGIYIHRYDELDEKNKKYCDDYFDNSLFPVLTPLAFDIGHPFPHISNLSLNLALVLLHPTQGEVFARLKIPDMFPRLIPLSVNARTKQTSKKTAGLVQSKGELHFIYLEDLIRTHSAKLFPGLAVLDSTLFRVTRNADIEIEEDEAEDLLDSIKEGIDRRRFGSVVRLQIEKGCPKRIKQILTENLEIDPFQVYISENPIGKSSLSQIADVERGNLKFTPFSATIPDQLEDPTCVFSAIREGDILLFHPYDSYRPVVDFLNQAASDPDVLAIKQTLYRTGRNSPIVAALIRACQAGKHVAVLVELKARFDEENNIGWARELENAGAHVVYGVMGLKTHAKLCLVIRKEGERISRYVHLGTGNYNPFTAKVYTDMGLLTRNPDIASDVSELFNFLTGYSQQSSYRKLLVAPSSIREAILSKIQREIDIHAQEGEGYILIKLNALSDVACIDALYKASQAGVKVDLQIRGICCLRPGVVGLSENISVTSIVGRFLEHPRIFYFKNGGDEEVYLGSADLMPRNLDRRVEVLFPIEDSFLKQSIIKGIFPVLLSDNQNTTVLNEDGEYERIMPGEAGDAFDVHDWLLRNNTFWHRPVRQEESL